VHGHFAESVSLKPGVLANRTATQCELLRSVIGFCQIFHHNVVPLSLCLSVCLAKKSRALNETPSQNYGVPLATSDHLPPDTSEYTPL